MRKYLGNYYIVLYKWNGCLYTIMPKSAKKFNCEKCDFTCS